MKTSTIISSGLSLLGGVSLIAVAIVFPHVAVFTAPAGSALITAALVHVHHSRKKNGTVNSDSEEELDPPPSPEPELEPGAGVSLGSDHSKSITYAYCAEPLELSNSAEDSPPSYVKFRLAKMKMYPRLH